MKIFGIPSCHGSDNFTKVKILFKIMKKIRTLKFLFPNFGPKQEKFSQYRQNKERKKTWCKKKTSHYRWGRKQNFSIFAKVDQTKVVKQCYSWSFYAFYKSEDIWWWFGDVKNHIKLLRWRTKLFLKSNFWERGTKSVT